MPIQHIGRGNQLIVCLPCLREEHAGCLDDRPGDHGIACHCKTCRPAPCERCFPPPSDGHHRDGALCPGCSTQLPLTGVCDYGCPPADQQRGAA